MTALYRAAWVLPISAPPIRDGWIAVADGRIVGLGAAEFLPDILRGPILHSTDSTLADTAILPGLVNAHAHLELSWMRGQVPPRESMPAWAASLMSLRRGAQVDPLPAIEAAV